MKILVRLAFIIPAIVVAGPAAARDTMPPRITAQTTPAGESPIHYRALDRMIRGFVAQTRPTAKVVRSHEPRLISWNGSF